MYTLALFAFLARLTNCGFIVTSYGASACGEQAFVLNGNVTLLFDPHTGTFDVDAPRAGSLSAYNDFRRTFPARSDFAAYVYLHECAAIRAQLEMRYWTVSECYWRDAHTLFVAAYRDGRLNTLRLNVTDLSCVVYGADAGDFESDVRGVVFQAAVRADA